MKTASDFIWQVPGENAEIDAYNLVLAALKDHDLWFESVCDHQDTVIKMGEVLAVVTSWLVMMYQNMKPVEREMLLAGYREIAAKNVDPAKPRNW